MHNNELNSIYSEYLNNIHKHKGDMHLVSWFMFIDFFEYFKYIMYDIEFNCEIIDNHASKRSVLIKSPQTSEMTNPLHHYQ